MKGIKSTKSKKVLSPDNLLSISAEITTALSEGKQVWVAADPAQRELFKENIAYYLGKVITDQITIVALPNTLNRALNYGRGQTKVHHIVIDEQARFFSTIHDNLKAVVTGKGHKTTLSLYSKAYNDELPLAGK